MMRLLGLVVRVVCGMFCAATLLAQSRIDARPGARGVRAPTEARSGPDLADTFGTNVSFLRIDAAEFSPVASGVQYSSIANGLLRYSTTSADFAMIAPMRLPGGAQLVYIELDYFDGSTTGSVIASPGVCAFSGETCTFLPGTGCADDAFALCSGTLAANGFSRTSSAMAGNGVFIDNFEHRYIVAVANTSTDGSTALSGIVVGYKLQVSPAPDTATFGDVPTGHPFFQFVEALAASGVTGGCGGGNYCPDAPVTRGQMAVFLAKALGLQFH